MARRASKKAVNLSAGAIIGIVAVIIAAVLGIILIKKESTTTTSGDIPWNVLVNNPSHLENNSYKIQGKVGDRFPRGKAELITFLCKDGTGRELPIPIIIYPEVKQGININRDQEYMIDIRVENLSNNIKGLCIATNIQPK